jgi:Zn ribbon nucleic-acid-binding protein
LEQNIQYTQNFSSTLTGEECIIYSNANCKTENIIYLLECAMCGLQFMREIKQQLNKRLIGHRIDAKTFGFPESQDGWFFEDIAQFWVFLYGCPVLTNDVG